MLYIKDGAALNMPQLDTYKLLQNRDFGNPFRVVQIPFQRAYNSVYDAALNIVSDPVLPVSFDAGTLPHCGMST
ncbi:MAG: hypothetical protein NUK65_02645 [Firmicutes bacterium]|nr:hypothetical protein [Bacillota bacterium]